MAQWLVEMAPYLLALVYGGVIVLLIIWAFIIDGP